MSLYNYFLIGVLFTFFIDILLFGLLIYGFLTNFDDGNGYDKFN